MIVYDFLSSAVENFEFVMIGCGSLVFALAIVLIFFLIEVI